MNDQLHRLPIAIGPAHHETVTSYVKRLATLHAIPYEHLWRHLSAPQPYGLTSARRRLVVAERLAAVTGRYLAALERAMPELRNPASNWQEWRYLPQHACPGCTSRHPGGPVVQLFAHHEFVCTRHGYWIGPPVPTVPGLQPRQLVRLVPELAAAQRRHTRLLRCYGWQRVFDAIDASTTLCVDQRFSDPLDAAPRRVWQQRLDLLIPTRRWFNTSVFLAAFYPEIVNLAALFCAPAWRPTAAEALHSKKHLLAISTEISRAIGRGGHPCEMADYQTTAWLRSMIDMSSRVHPARAFPQTRRVTHDGVPTNWSASDDNLARKAAKEYSKHQHVPVWALPRTTRRPAYIDEPTSFEPDPDNRYDLFEQLAESVAGLGPLHADGECLNEIPVVTTSVADSRRT